MRYAVNLSLLFTELDLLDRPAAAKAAGFDAVEFWWPFPTATPTPTQVEGFVSAIADAGVSLIGLNFFAGDMSGGDRGLVSWPGRESEFLASVDVAARIAGRLGTAAFNALYGNRLPGVDPAEQDAVAVANLAEAARRVDGVVLLEPVSGAPHYPLRTAGDVVAVLDRVGATNLALLADLYHLSVNGDDLTAVIDKHTGRIGHVQFADAPGRNEPGTGSLDIGGYLRQLAAHGYAGYAAAEYRPSGATVDSFAWKDTLR